VILAVKQSRWSQLLIASHCVQSPLSDPISETSAFLKTDLDASQKLEDRIDSNNKKGDGHKAAERPFLLKSD